MFLPANIAQHFKVVFLAITLLCVVSLNNREVNTYVPAAKSQTAEQVNKSAADRHGSFKQKVSFEATPSYVILQLATCPEVLRVVFATAIVPIMSAPAPAGTLYTFFSRFLASVIQPNAP